MRRGKSGKKQKATDELAYASSSVAATTSSVAASLSTLYIGEESETKMVSIVAGRRYVDIYICRLVCMGIWGWMVIDKYIDR